MNQQQPQAYVGLCRFERFQDPEGADLVAEPGQTLPTFEASIACWVGSAVDYDELLAAALPKQGYRLLRTEEVMPITTWFEMKGFNAALGELAAKVSPSRRFQIGVSRPVAFEQSHGMAGTDDSARDHSPLQVTTHAFTPVPDQTPVWPWDQRQWIDDDLKQILFRQDLPPDQQYILGPIDPDNPPLIRTYCIIDGWLRSQVNLFPDLDRTWRKYVVGTEDTPGPNGNQHDIDVRCLFKGETQEELKDVAPYLVDMTLPDRAYQDDRYVPDFHRNFFNSIWDPVTLERAEGRTHLDTGIFIRTTADFDTVWQHFRKFPRLEDENGKGFFWRFWDPITLRTMIAEFNEAQFDKLADRKYLLLGKGLGNQIISLNFRPDIAARTTPTNIKIKQPKLNHFVTTKTLTVSVEERVRRYKEKAISFLRKHVTGNVAHLTDEELSGVAILAYKNSKKRGFLKEKEHLKYLIATVFWGSYFETDPQYYSQLIDADWQRIDDNGKLVELPYILDLLKEVSKTRVFHNLDLERPKRVILGFERIYSQPSSKVTYDTVTQRLLNIWPTRCKSLAKDRIRAFVGSAGEIAQSKYRLTGPDLETYVSLALYFGYNFACDPLHPWAAQALILDDPNARRHALAAGVANHFTLRGYLKEEHI